MFFGRLGELNAFTDCTEGGQERIVYIRGVSSRTAGKDRGDRARGMNPSKEGWIQKLLNEFSYTAIIQFRWNHVVIDTPVFGVGQVSGGSKFGVIRHWRVQFMAIVVGVHDVGDVGRGDNRELVIENGLDVLDVNERVSIKGMKHS